jgi:hypothetical protein
LYQTLANIATEKTLPYFPFPEEVCLEKETKQNKKQKKKEKKDTEP